MTNLTLQYNDIASYAEQLQQYGTEEAFSRYAITVLFERHEAVQAKLSGREEALQVRCRGAWSRHCRPGGSLLMSKRLWVSLCVVCVCVQTALATEQTKEALRVQFAEKAAAFKALCDDRSRQVADLDGALEAQIGVVQGLRGEYDSFVALLEEAQTISDSMEQWGVIGNPHTPETILSLRAVYDALYKVRPRASSGMGFAVAVRALSVLTVSCEGIVGVARSRGAC